MPAPGDLDETVVQAAAIAGSKNNLAGGEVKSKTATVKGASHEDTSSSDTTMKPRDAISARAWAGTCK